LYRAIFGLMIHMELGLSKFNGHWFDRRKKQNWPQVKFFCYQRWRKKIVLWTIFFVTKKPETDTDEKFVSFLAQ
jgi:hypothetical protein